jgi:rRNA-processing protein FCF1
VKREKQASIKIILDSNALFVPLQFKIDIFEDLRRLLNANFELILLSPVLREMERLANEGSPRMRKNASYGLKLAQKCRIIDFDVDYAPSVDEAIIKFTRRRKWPVFTNDRRLRKRLRDINVPVIYVRQKSRLEINGAV